MKNKIIVALFVLFFSFNTFGSNRTDVICKGKAYEGGFTYLFFRLDVNGSQLAVSADNLTGNRSNDRRQFIPSQQFEIGLDAQSFNISAIVKDTIGGLGDAYLEVIKSPTELRANYFKKIFNNDYDLFVESVKCTTKSVQE